MPAFNTITIKGFKSIASIENLELRPINLLIGPNGSGKSNFIEVFNFLRAISEGGLQNYLLKANGANKVLYFGSKRTETIQIRISFNEGDRQYRHEIDLHLADNDQMVPQQENVYIYARINSDGKLNSEPYEQNIISSGREEAGISDPKRWNSGHVKYIHWVLNRLRPYHFHDTSRSSPMRVTSSLNDNRYFRSDGSNLAAFLYYLRKRHEVTYGLIRRAIQRAAPFFDDFLLEPLQLNESTIRLEWKHKGSDIHFDVSSLSDGTLRFMALATLFLQPDEYRPPVILLDEPEIGLHPYAIGLLAELIQEASTTTQVIVATQSPLLLDYFKPEDLLVADRVNEVTRLTRLDSTRLATWLEDYSLGQLWEKNELGGRHGD